MKLTGILTLWPPFQELVVLAPEVAGIEMALPARRTHYRLRHERTHYRLAKSRTQHSFNLSLTIIRELLQ